MPRRKDESVAAGPLGIGQVVTQEPVPQDVSGRCRPQHHPRIPGLRFLDGIDRQETNGVDAKAAQGFVGSHLNRIFLTCTTLESGNSKRNEYAIGCNSRKALSKCTFFQAP